MVTGDSICVNDELEISNNDKVLAIRNKANDLFKMIFNAIDEESREKLLDYDETISELLEETQLRYYELGKNRRA